MCPRNRNIVDFVPSSSPSSPLLDLNVDSEDEERMTVNVFVTVDLVSMWVQQYYASHHSEGELEETVELRNKILNSVLLCNVEDPFMICEEGDLNIQNVSFEVDHQDLAHVKYTVIFPITVRYASDILNIENRDRSIDIIRNSIDDLLEFSRYNRGTIQYSHITY